MKLSYRLIPAIATVVFGTAVVVAENPPASTPAAPPVAEQPSAPVAEKPLTEEEMNKEWKSMPLEEKARYIKIYRTMRDLPEEERRMMQDRLERYAGMSMRRSRTTAEGMPADYMKQREEMLNRRREMEERMRAAGVGDVSSPMPGAPGAGWPGAGMPGAGAGFGYPGVPGMGGMPGAGAGYPGAGELPSAGVGAGYPGAMGMPGAPGMPPDLERMRRRADGGITPEMLEELKLSEEQRAKLPAIQEQLRKEREEAMTNWRNEHMKLREEMNTAQQAGDEAKVRELQTKWMERSGARPRHQFQQQYVEKVREILDAGQQKKLEQLLAPAATDDSSTPVPTAD